MIRRLLLISARLDAFIRLLPLCWQLSNVRQVGSRQGRKMAHKRAAAYLLRSIDR